MERKYWYWINNIEGIGNTKIRNLLNFTGDPSRIFEMDKSELLKVPSLTEKDTDNLLSVDLRKRIFEKYEKDLERGVKFVFPSEDEYPVKLKEIYDKPYILYYRGRLPSPERKQVAIVGSRNCSEYGRYVARELARVISGAGAEVISGLAYGIDSEAHKGAVMSGGITYGVLAGGVDKCYPPDNYNLYMDIVNSGGILSEYPGNSITRPGMFPLRNRIISGISDAVIVVEAGHKSGSLITAALALEQNREIYAVPGRIGDVTGRGCNELIAEGALVVTDFDSILTNLGLESVKSKKIIKNDIALASDEKMLYSQLLDFTPRSLESLIIESKLNPEQVIRCLTGLEIKGVIREISKNYYTRVQ